MGTLDIQFIGLNLAVGTVWNTGDIYEFLSHKLSGWLNSREENYHSIATHRLKVVESGLKSYLKHLLLGTKVKPRFIEEIKTLYIFLWRSDEDFYTISWESILFDIDELMERTCYE